MRHLLDTPVPGSVCGGDDAPDEILVTAASSLEVATKLGTGRLAAGGHILRDLAFVEGARLVTADRAMDGFGAELLW